MYINKDYPAGICLLTPHGTNNTMFTECCNCAINNNERHCPACGRNVIGFDAETDYKRGKIRWRYATSRWERK